MIFLEEGGNNVINKYLERRIELDLNEMLEVDAKNSSGVLSG